MTDLYSILNISPSSSPEEIKKSYKKLALIWHPDKRSKKRKIPREYENNEDYTHKIQKLNEAKHTLLNDALRLEYNRQHGFPSTWRSSSSSVFDFIENSIEECLNQIKHTPTFINSITEPSPIIINVDLPFIKWYDPRTVYYNDDNKVIFRDSLCSTCKGFSFVPTNCLCNEKEYMDITVECKACQGNGFTLKSGFDFFAKNPTDIDINNDDSSCSSTIKQTKKNEDDLAYGMSSPTYNEVDICSVCMGSCRIPKTHATKTCPSCKGYGVSRESFELKKICPEGIPLPCHLIQNTNKCCTVIKGIGHRSMRLQKTGDVHIIFNIVYNTKTHSSSTSSTSSSSSRKLDINGLVCPKSKELFSVNSDISIIKDRKCTEESSFYFMSDQNFWLDEDDETNIKNTIDPHKISFVDDDDDDDCDDYDGHTHSFNYIDNRCFDAGLCMIPACYSKQNTLYTDDTEDLYIRTCHLSFDIDKNKTDMSCTCTINWSEALSGICLILPIHLEKRSIDYNDEIMVIHRIKENTLLATCIPTWYQDEWTIRSWGPRKCSGQRCKYPTFLDEDVIPVDYSTYSLKKDSDLNVHATLSDNIKRSSHWLPKHMPFLIFEPKTLETQCCFKDASYNNKLSMFLKSKNIETKMDSSCKTSNLKIRFNIEKPDIHHGCIIIPKDIRESIQKEGTIETKDLFRILKASTSSNKNTSFNDKNTTSFSTL